MKIHPFYLLLGLILLMSGCVAPKQEAPVLKSSLDGDWQSTHSKANVRFDHGKLSGSDGCNRFAGNYTVEGNRLSVGENMMSTMMACPNMDKSIAFKNALLSAKNYENDGKRLLLIGGNGKMLLEFNPLSNTPEEGLYRLLHLNNGKHAVVTLKTPITLQIDPNGKMSGNTGCNQYTTSYTIKEGQITIGFPATTRKMCPSEQMEQEQQFIAVLSKASLIQRNGEKWEIRDTSGALLFDMIQQ
jgi:heat shock protein HslJ